jgi:hypothetical protein
MHIAIKECKNIKSCIPRMNYDFVWHLFKRKLSINKYIEMRFCQIRRELRAVKNWLYDKRRYPAILQETRQQSQSIDFVHTVFSDSHL